MIHLETHLQFAFRYDPEIDGRILMGKVDCTEEVDLCKRYLLLLLLGVVSEPGLY